VLGEIMVIETDEMISWTARKFTPKTKVEIIAAISGVATDITSRVLTGKFRQSIFRIGIGNFNIDINNIGGIYSGTWAGGDTVKFYADLGDGTTEKFIGRVDSVKENISKKGQILTVNGRHATYLLTEKFVNKTYENKTIDVILKDLVDSYLKNLDNHADFTYANVNAFTETFTLTWSNKSVIECMKDLCEIGSADGYVDNDLDFHLFQENSIVNTEDGFAEGVRGRNLFYIRNYGEDTYYEKDKVTVIGNDNEGLEIIHTAGSGNRESRPIVNISLDTMDEVKDFAIAKLAEGTNVPPQAIMSGYALPSVNPGENIWITSLRNKINKALKVVEYTDIVGSRSRGIWTAEVKAEREPTTIAQQMKVRAQRELELVRVTNPNNLEFSYNFPFDDDTNTLTDSTTQRIDGYLATDGSVSGTWISSTRTADSDITQVELKYKGENNEGTVFKVSVDSGLNWVTATKDSLINPFPYSGNRVALRVEFSSASAKVYSIAILYK